MNFINLLKSEEIIDWFFDRDIIPGQSNLIKHDDYVSIMFDAIDQGTIFKDFLKEVIVNSGHHEYVVNVDNWEELYQAYASYLTGHLGYKS